MSSVVDAVGADRLLADAAAHLSRGDAISAEHCFREVTRVAETRLEGWNGLAATLGLQGRHDDAWRAAERALALDADPCSRETAYVNAGVALRALERYDDALALYREWLPRRPRPEAHCDYAFTLFAHGRFQEGWPSFEQRWLLNPLFGMQGRPAAPPWRGQAVTGRTVLVRAEQGLGDTIQFMRYAADLKERGATVLALVQPGLEDVIATVPGVDRVLPGSAGVQYDFYVNALSLPYVLGVSPFSGSVGPYVAADAGRRERWRRRLPSGQFKVGLAWAGNPSHARDRERSIPFASFREILRDTDAQFVSLQKGAAAVQSAQALRERGVHDFGSELDTLADTAALVAELDLVICVDTAVAHLAGAMGIPAWLLLPRPADWRWGISGTTTPWYPSMTLFRQDTAGDWMPPIRRVVDALASGVGSVSNAAADALPPSPVAEVQFAAPADAVADTAIGLMAFRLDGAAGRSMLAYGEYLQQEVAVLGAITPADGSVVMLGAAAHTHPVALARGLAARGTLACAELSPLDYQLLRANLDRHELRSVTLAVRQGGAPAAVLDRLAGTRLDVVYVDCESGLDVASVLEASCLWTLRPRLFVRGVAEAAAQGVADALKSLGTRVWLVRTPYYRQDNHHRNPIDVFGGAHAIAFVAAPEEVVPPDAILAWPEF